MLPVLAGALAERGTSSLVARGELPTGYATDDGVGLVYRGTELAEVVSEEDGKAAYRVEPDGAGGVIETLLEPRLLPPAH